MPDKALSVATYAAGASLAAITLIYVFAPTYFIDSDANSNRKKGVVGLHNPANDCFINSVLQALAGLGELRLYLIRETHRRRLDGDDVYDHVVRDEPPPDAPRRRAQPEWEVEGLQRGLVTKGLKDILDALNERPIWKKTISAGPFVRVLEASFRKRVNRSQQDAQEFLQIVAERLCDEYHAGHNARRRARAVPATISRQDVSEVLSDDGTKITAGGTAAAGDGEEETRHLNGGDPGAATGIPMITTNGSDPVDTPEEEETEDGFPMEGRMESQIECLTCGFKPKATPSSFCTLTLNVPERSTTLSGCFDGLFKTEYIEGFKCEKCRLVHARDWYKSELRRLESKKAGAKGSVSTTTTEEYKRIEHAITEIERAIDTDPEKPPSGVELPDSSQAPQRKIRRHLRITHFPKVLAIHLSRSVFTTASSKNSHKVSFPEKMTLGGLVRQQKYGLLGVVMHKGSHSSGHYESFRRQAVAAPYSTPAVFQQGGVYGYSRNPSPSGTPQLQAAFANGSGGSTEGTAVDDQVAGASPRGSTPDLLNLPPGAGALSPRSQRSLTLTTNASTPSLGSATSGPSGTPQRHDATRSVTSISGPTSNGGSSPAMSPGSESTVFGRQRGGTDTDAGSIKSSRSAIQKAHLQNGGSSKGSEGGRVATAEKTAGAEAEDTVMAAAGNAKLRRRKQADRWWRISDDRIKEARTHDVLSMQREVYLLFYELAKDGGDTSSSS